MVYFAVAAYATLHGIPVGAIAQTNGLLIGLPALFLWIPIAFLLANVILATVPPLRRIALDYVAKTGRPGFSESQNQLLKLFKWSAFVCVPLIALGWLV